MLQIVNDAALTNDRRSEKMEQFFIEEGLRAGVISEVKARVPANPNRLGKQLAPWFGEECREAKKGFRNACRTHGKASSEARAAYRVFTKTCKRARWQFARKMPDMLKYSPNSFWKMLRKGKESDDDVDLR